MASAQGSESQPPAIKRAKSSDFDSDIAPKVAKTQFECGPPNYGGNRNPSGKFPA